VHKVAIIRAKGNRREGIVQAVDSLGGMERFVRKGETVAIKPNLCNSKYQYPVTSTVEAASVILDLVRPLTSEIIVVESPNASMNPELKYAALGYDTLKGVKLINLHKNSLAKGKEFDKLINLCNLKTSEVATVTCGLKNIFGCYPQRTKAKMHAQIAQAIVDINQQYSSDLVIIDALTAMEGQGPLFGTPVEMDLIIAGDNVVATDFVACKIMGIEPSEVEHLMLAAKCGLGDINNIEFLGESIDSVKKQFRKADPEPLIRRLKHFISSYETPSKILAKAREVT